MFLQNRWSDHGDPVWFIIVRPHRSKPTKPFTSLYPSPLLSGIIYLLSRLLMSVLAAVPDTRRAVNVRSSALSHQSYKTLGIKSHRQQNAALLNLELLRFRITTSISARNWQTDAILSYFG